MAKNLLEQFLDYATSKLTGPLGDDIYIKEETEVSSGLTGVARYLAKQEQAAQAAAAMTGVAKYLAKQAVAAAPAVAAEAGAVPEAEEAAPAAPMSRVEKYLASQQAAAPAAAEAPAAPSQEPAAPMSRVAKYLASQAAAAAKAVAAEASPAAAEPAPVAPMSRVEKYLASQQAAAPAAAEAPAESAAPAPAAVSEDKAEQESNAPLSRVAKYLAAVGKEFKPDVANKSETVPEPEAESAKRTGVSKYLASQNKSVAESSGIASVAQVIKDLGKVEASSEEIEIAGEDEAADALDNVIRLDEGKQCQASTAKGTQCRNKSNLGHIQLTVNDREYRFSVCTQHNNENFKPFAELLES